MNQTSTYIKALSHCDTIFEADRKDLQAVSKRLSNGLSNDIETLKKENFIFSGSTDIAQTTSDCVDFIRRWHVLGDPPSMAALCAYAAEHFAIKSKECQLALMMASVMGELENTQPYHNNNHFRKVLLQTIRLIEVHNRIYGGTRKAFDEEQVTILLVAACIHDFGHDGMGNTIKGIFHQSRLELLAFEETKPFLHAVGFEHDEVIKAILVSTEVSPLNDPANSMMQMKAAYRFHFLGENKKFERLNLSSSLKILETNEKVCLMACLLHEADMATSAGLTYEMTCYETVLVRDEIGTRDAKPEHIVEFLDVICQRQFLSDAGQKLYAANMGRIYALAEEAVKDGNALLPKAEHTDFILSFGQNKDGSPKTLN